ncbi:unnamed protein product [Rhizoctonia solani]|nr:unnamed protein product [Rhizoctonia solani]
MKAGTYRIVNLSNGEAITEKDSDIVVSSKADSEYQQWFVQHAGDGYQIKNVASGGYLAAIAEIGYEGRLQAPYSGRYPTTWMLVADPANRGRTMYGIILADAGVALNSYLNDHEISIFPESTSSSPSATWTFEHIRTDEEVTGITQVQATVDLRTEEMIKSQEAEIAFLRQLITDGRQEAAKLKSQVERLQSLSRGVGSEIS